jgi:hypothetical protein
MNADEQRQEILQTKVNLKATPLATPQLLGGSPPEWIKDQPVQLHIAWRRQYDARRYARHLSQAELNQRMHDLVLNTFGLSPDGKISLNSLTDATAGMFMEKFAHVMEELQLRYGPYPAGVTREIFRAGPLPNFATELGQKAAKRIAPFGLKRGDVFIKFGKREYMERLYELGALRVQPASYFRQTEHNSAIRDDELTLTISVALSRDDVVGLVMNPQDVPQDVPEQRVDVQLVSPTDYWLYCLTNSVGPRLFVDFNADSCVIIRDRARFSQMLREATLLQLNDVALLDGPAEYVDPLLPPATKITVPLAKHFRYTYQDEHRFSWLPRSPIEEVAHVDLQIGSLKDFSDLIVL